MSAGMSLIFNVAKRLDEITNVYADSALAQIAGFTSKISSKSYFGAVLINPSSAGFRQQGLVLV